MIRFKHEVDEKLFPYLSPMLIKIIGDVAQWCQDKDLKFVITETISSKERDLSRGILRTSTTHSTGRAIDIRTRGWSAEDVTGMVDWFELRYQTVSARRHGGDRKLMVFGDSKHQFHVHCQVHSQYSMENIWTRKDKAFINSILRDD